MILGFTGETIKIITKIKASDGSPADLSIATIVFALKKPNGSTIFKTPTIDENSVEVVLYEEVDVAGEYQYELKISINGEVDTVARDTIMLHQSLIPAINLDEVVGGG